MYSIKYLSSMIGMYSNKLILFKIFVLFGPWKKVMCVKVKEKTLEFNLNASIYYTTTLKL